MGLIDLSRVLKLLCALSLSLSFTTAFGAEYIIRIVRVDPLQEQLNLSADQLNNFITAYKDYSKKKISGIRRARLKARGSDDATRRVSRAVKKANEKFDKDAHEILTDEQFTLYLAAREQIVGSLADRRSGFSDASIPNPGGLLAEHGGGN